VLVATAHDIGDGLFEATDADEVRVALRSVVDALIVELQRHLDEALRGSDDAARNYVRSCRSLADALLEQGRGARPDLILDGYDGRLTVADANGHAAGALLGVLENASVDAPFLSWTATFESGDAVALELVNRLRMLVGARTLAPPAAPVPPPVDDLAAQRFQRRVRHYLNHPEDENPLLRLLALFALSKSELGRLFGVTRQSIDGWLAHGVPSDRQEKLATLLALADLLERKLKPRRIPGVARRPAEAYGGGTMLELIASDRQRELLELVRESFDWSQAA